MFKETNLMRVMVCMLSLVITGGFHMPTAWAAGNLRTSPDVYKEDFSTGGYYSYSGAIEGWGSGGPLTLPPVLSSFPQTSRNPITFHGEGRLLYGSVNDAPRWGYPNSTLLLYGKDGSCYIQRYQHTVNDNYPGTDYRSGTTVMNNIPCTDNSIMLVTQLNLRDDAVYDYIILTPNNFAWDGYLVGATAYLAKGNGDHPTFTAVDISPVLQNAGVSIHAQGQLAAFSDVNHDGLADMYILTGSGTTQQLLLFIATSGSSPWMLKPTPLVAIPNLGFSTPIANINLGAPSQVNCETASVTRGPTSFALLDFDGDGQTDCIVSSVSDQNLHFFHGRKSGEFQRGNDIPFPPGGAQFLSVVDSDNDYSPDLFVARGHLSCGDESSGGYLLKGQNQSGHFRMRPLYLDVSSGSVDWMTSAFRYMYDQRNFQYTKSSDVLFGNKTDPGILTQWFNLPVTARYSTYGVATNNSINKGNLALVNALIKAPTSVPNGSQLKLFVTPDGGDNFEPVLPEEMTGSGPAHHFSHFGTSLQFRTTMTSPPVIEGGYLTQSMPLSNVTPSLSSVSMNLDGMTNQARFSRSTITSGNLSRNGINKPVNFFASFLYPGYDGHLVAYDNNAGDANATDSIVATNATILWDAGELLRNRSTASRVLYTAYPSKTITSPKNVVTSSLSRLGFTQGEVDTPSSPAGQDSLRMMLELFDDFRDVLINQLRAGVTGLGQDANPKMKDMGHGDPVLINPPGQDPLLMGNSYEKFVSDQKNRRPFVLKGSNSGFLHAFDANNGTELWGFAPHESLSAIGAQASYDVRANVVNYSHTTTVDGPTSVGDVFAKGAWHTVAITGQATGAADSNNNYYFALDVTDPTNPQPLWEVTQPILFGKAICDYNTRCQQVSCTPQITQNSNCITQNYAFNSRFEISYDNVDDSGRPYGAVQGEDYQLEIPASRGNSGDWKRFSSSSSQKGKDAHDNAYVQAVNSSTTCPTGSGKVAHECARVDYSFFVDNNAAGVYNIMLRIWNDNAAHQVSLFVDNQFIFGAEPQLFSTTKDSWRWGKTTSVALDSGSHILNLYTSSPGLAIDAIAFKQSNSTPPTADMTSTAMTGCDLSASTPSCSVSCLADTDAEWPECGVGANMKCCASGGASYCVPVGSSCASPPPAMGQTFSPPAFARLKGSSGDIWAAFFGSGYNTSAAYNVGRSIYAVDAYSGILLGEWDLPDVSESSKPDIQTTVAGGMALVDADNDGYVDRVYFGDTAGRLWKLNTYPTISGSGVNALSSAYSTCVVFDAGDPNRSGVRNYAPVTMTPGVAVVADKTPNIFFGTGSAPSISMTQRYRFYSVRDPDPMNSCSAAVKKEADLKASNLEWVVTDSSPGFRFWGDPTVVDNAIVYWTSMYGDPDWISSADNQSTTSHIFGRAVQDYIDAKGTAHQRGSSVLTNNSSFLTTAGSIQSGAVLGGATVAPVTRGGRGMIGTAPTNLYMNTIAGDVVRLSTTGTQKQNRGLKRLGWREISL